MMHLSFRTSFPYPGYVPGSTIGTGHQREIRPLAFDESAIKDYLARFQPFVSLNGRIKN